MFETQRLANYFPEETRVRDDPSSFGFRLFSIIGDINSSFYRDLKRLQLSSGVKSNLTDFVSTLYEWDIDSFDFQYENDIETNNIIVPSISGDSFVLSEVLYSEELPFSLPTRLTENQIFLLQTGTIYQSNINSSSTINDIIISSNLWIEFSNVDQFSIVQDSSKERSLRFPAEILLVGEDSYGTEIKESIYPSSNGIYKTKNIFSKLLDFTLTNISGVSGEIRIKNFDFNLDNYFSVFFPLVESFSSDTLLVSYDENFVYLKKFIFPVSDYKRINDDMQIFTGMTLKNSEEEQIQINDIAFIPSTETLVALDNNGIHFYKNWLPPIFNKPSVERSLEITLTAEVPNHYPMINEQIRFYLYQRSINNRVKNYSVKLTDPNGLVFYLQSDDSFSENEWYFNADTDSKWPGNTVNDRWIDFQLDSYGQWDLSIEATLSNDVVEVDVTSFYVIELISDISISLDSVYNGVSYHQDGLIYLKNDSGIISFRPRFDYFFIDSTNKRVYTIEEYENLDVSYE